MPEHPTQFKLIPLDAAEMSSVSFEDDAVEGAGAGESPRKKAPEAKRIFSLEAASAETKARWLKTLRGKLANGRHRADSGTFAPYYAIAAAGGRSSVGGAAAAVLGAGMGGAGAGPTAPAAGGAGK